MQSWDELWRVVKEIRAAAIHPPQCASVYWAGKDKTLEERERDGVIIAATRTFKELLEGGEVLKDMAAWVDMDYKSAGVLVKNKTWIKLHPAEGKVVFIWEKIPGHLHVHLEAMRETIERAMKDRVR